MTLEHGSSPRPSGGDDRLLRLRLRRPARVIAREVGEWLMLIDIDTGFTYEANWLGAQVWRLLGEGHSVEEACAVLAKAHRHSRDDIEKDVSVFVRDLLGYGLVSAEAVPVAAEALPIER
jgi:uncharacterized protein YoaH (UPF0181 family)